MVYFSSTSILSSCVTCKAKYMVSKFSTQDYCWSSLLINICIYKISFTSQLLS